MMPGIRLNLVRIECITAISATLLATGVNDWIKANAGQRTFLGIFYDFDGATYTAILSYVE